MVEWSGLRFMAQLQKKFLNLAAGQGDLIV